MSTLTPIRVVVGAAMLAKLTDLVPMTLALGDADKMRAPVVPSLPYPPEAVVWVAAAVVAGAALLMIVGVADRLAAAVIAATVALVFGLDAQLYANHLYLLGLVAFVWAAAPVDARVLSYRWLATVVYGFATLAKLNVTYLTGLALARTLDRDGLLPWPEPLQVWWVMTVVAVVSVAAEGLVAVGLWFDRTRREAVVVGVLLHLAMFLFVKASVGIVVFGTLAMSLYVAFAPGASGVAGADAGEPVGAHSAGTGARPVEATIRTTGGK